MSLGPIESLRFVHNAIRSEAAQLEDAAHAASSPQQAAELGPRLDFLSTLLERHQSGEEAGLFPALDEVAPSVADAYRFDHDSERALGKGIMELVQKCGEGDEAALSHLRRQLVVMRESISSHSTKEDELILPLVAKHFDAPAQAQIIGKILSTIPKQDMPKAVPWIVERQSQDDAAAYVSVLMKAMPPEAFVAAKGWIREGVSGECWTALTARLPELTS